MTGNLERRTDPNCIGFLRLLLASMVVVGHAIYIGQFGEDPMERIFSARTVIATMAVQGFFCLSGYLVVQSFLRLNSLPRYLWHRVLRLAPALIVCLILTAFAFTPLLHFLRPATEANLAGLSPSPLEYVLRNLPNPRTVINVGPYPQTWNRDWNGCLWTLPYEFECYLGLAMLGFCGILGRLKILYAAGVALILILLVLDTAYGVAAFLPLLRRSFDTPGKLLAIHFMVGSLFGVFPQLLTNLKKSRWIGPLSVVILAFSWFGPANDSISPLAFPPAIMWIAYRLPVFDFEKMVGGDFSYGIYIYGYPVEEFLAALGYQSNGLPIYLVTSAAITLALAVASWKLVERRALGLKNMTFPRLVS